MVESNPLTRPAIDPFKTQTQDLIGVKQAKAAFDSVSREYDGCRVIVVSSVQPRRDAANALLPGRMRAMAARRDGAETWLPMAFHAPQASLAIGNSPTTFTSSFVTTY